jgi:hypothetical protein
VRVARVLLAFLCLGYEVAAPPMGRPSMAACSMAVAQVCVGVGVNMCACVNARIGRPWVAACPVVVAQVGVGVGLSMCACVCECE